MKSVCAAVLILFSSCAVSTKGILLEVEPATPLDQRDLHKHCDLGDSAACALTHADRTQLPAAIIPIVQGIAPPDRAVFAALVPKASHYSWFLYDRELGQLWKLHTARIQSRPQSAWAVQRVEIRGIEPNHDYDLLASDQTGKLIEDRTFRTLSAEKDSLRVALVSGLKSHGRHDANQVIASVQQRKPSLILFTGENIDVMLSKKQLAERDSAAFDFFFEKYAQSRGEDSFARDRHLTPVGATWNESEYGTAKGDRTFAFRDRARETLEMFFPRWADEEIVVNGPGTSLAFKLGDTRLVLLDNRTFRAPDPVAPKPVCEKKGKKKVCTTEPTPLPAPGARFGHLQIDWLKRQYEKTELDTYLISGEPWFNAFSPDWADRATRPSSTLGGLAKGGFAILATQNEKIQVLEVVGAGK